MDQSIHGAGVGQGGRPAERDDDRQVSDNAFRSAFTSGFRLRKAAFKTVVIAAVLVLSCFVLPWASSAGGTDDATGRDGTSGTETAAVVDGQSLNASQHLNFERYSAFDTAFFLPGDIVMWVVAGASDRVGLHAVRDAIQQSYDSNANYLYIAVLSGLLWLAWIVLVLRLVDRTWILIANSRTYSRRAYALAQALTARALRR